MRKLLFMLVGFVLLAGAAYLLWMAYGPQPHEERTTGGVLTTQAELAAQGEVGGVDLGVVTDEGQSSTNALGAPAQLEPGALSDSASLEAGEAAPEMIAPQPGLTTDVVLGEGVGVEVAPLSLPSGAGAPAPAVPEGQGGAGVFTGTYEQRVVELEWPTSFRVEGAGTVRVKLKVLADGALQPVAEIADDEVLATPILLTDRYATHTGYVTGTISAPDFTVRALTDETQVLERGSEPEWRWTLEAGSSGESVIVLALSIRWEPNPGSGGTPINASIWGQTLKVDINYVFGGLTVPQASLAGTALAVLAFVAELPFGLSVLRRIFFPRRRRSTRRDTRSSARRRY
jgi:hypothetical protein